ncbi:hypothetical protein N0V90_005298, partial [Kalmusia sp. IMI 367209]
MRLSHVEFSVATCQNVQSSMVSGAAVVGGSTVYAIAELRKDRIARARVDEGFMVKLFQDR